MVRWPLVPAVTFIAALLILTSCSEDAPDASSPGDDPSSEPRAAQPSPTTTGTSVSGRFDVGERALFIACTGTGSPTVVLESGDGVPSQAMAGALVPELSRKVRVCSYDRANTGKSDIHKPIHKLIHLISTKCYPNPDRHILS